MSYTPRPGSLADRVITHLKKAGGEISSTDLAKRFNTATNNTNALLHPAISNGALVKRKDDDGRVWYGLGGDVPQASQAPARKAKAAQAQAVESRATEATPADTLTLARWSDGDLVITGHQTTDEGAVVLNRKQVEQLLLFVLPHYPLPGMAFLMNEAFKQQLLGE